MNRYHAVCQLGEQSGRVMLGTLQNDKLTITEIHHFENPVVEEKSSVQWDIPHVYRETLEGLRGIAAHEEPIDTLSCNSSASDYMLFGSDGALMTPTYHNDARSEDAMREILSRIPWEEIYDETGTQKSSASTLFQLAAEKNKRFKKAGHILPVADGFNYLLAGVARVELSSASATQLYNPMTQTWSERLLRALQLPPELFPPLVPAGTKLGALRPEIAKETKLEDAHIVTGCSHEMAATFAGLPIEPGEQWACLRLGSWSVMGTSLLRPIINDLSREWNFTNETGYGGSACFYKHVPGLWILEECLRSWKEKDRELDGDVITHLATSSPAFESLVNLADPRFLEPGDMPAKIQAYCKETNQPVPRKPGPLVRCVLESLALLYRRTLFEMKYLTGREFTKIYLLGSSPTQEMLNNFIANALQMPVVVAPDQAVAIGNVVVQGLAMGHFQSLDHARDVIRRSFKTETLTPHAASWESAFERLAGFVAG
jgi:rhamnulokinase